MTIPNPEPVTGPELTRERLRALRMMLGLLLEDLAPLLGYSWQHLARIERGDSPVPSDLAARLKPILIARMQDVNSTLHDWLPE